ncbi:MAG: hypothetical protein ABJ327_25900 [Litoreibacter sp.]
MKTTIAIAAAALSLSAPAYAQSAAEVLFAMSNNSAAEILVGETSMGDVDTAQVSLALGNMSAAERMGFFEADMSTRRQIIAAQLATLNGDSAAESN